MRRIAVASLLALALVLALFDVKVRPEFALPRDATVADPDQERRYEACVEARDRVIHEETFARVDNPDVQREILATRKDRARRECRDRFPVRTMTVREPFRCRLLEFRFRYRRQGAARRGT